MPDYEARLDNDLDVVTPENIAFQYRVSGPFRRMLAFSMDFFIIIAFFVVLGIVGVFIIPLLGELLDSLWNQDFFFDTFGGMAMMVYFIGFFLTFFFYGAVMETYFNGQTLGKMLFGIRVFSTDGRPINGAQAMVRNLTRLADCFPWMAPLSLFGFSPVMFNWIPAGAAGFVVMMWSKRYQRLGDLFAQTIVVVDEKSWHEGLMRIDDPRVAQLAEHIPQNFVVSKELSNALASYVDRRKNLSVARLMEIAKHLAVPLLEQFRFDPTVNHDLLICALYHRTFHDSDETYVPPGISPLATNQPPNPHQLSV